MCSTISFKMYFYWHSFGILYSIVVRLRGLNYKKVSNCKKAPTPMIRKLVSSTIFRHCLFRWYFQSAAVAWHKIKRSRILPLDVSLDMSPQIWATKNQRIRALSKGPNVRCTECDVRDFWPCLNIDETQHERVTTLLTRVWLKCLVKNHCESVNTLRTRN